VTLIGLPGMAPRRRWAVLAIFIIGLLVVGTAGCQALPATSGFTSPMRTLSPSEREELQTSLEAAVRDRLDQLLSSFLEEGVGQLETLDIEVREGGFGTWRGRVVPAACPLVRYELIYDGVLSDGTWELYEQEMTETNLARSWATAYSAAHDGARVPVPGSAIRREVALNPPIIIEILQAALQDPDNAIMRATAGFYICITDVEGYGNLSQEDVARVKELIPQVREVLSAAPQRSASQ